MQHAAASVCDRPAAERPLTNQVARIDTRNLGESGPAQASQLLVSGAGCAQTEEVNKRVNRYERTRFQHTERALSALPEVKRVVWMAADVMSFGTHAAGSSRRSAPLLLSRSLARAVALLLLRGTLSDLPRGTCPPTGVLAEEGESVPLLPAAVRWWSCPGCAAALEVRMRSAAACRSSSTSTTLRPYRSADMAANRSASSALDAGGASSRTLNAGSRSPVRGSRTPRREGRVFDPPRSARPIVRGFASPGSYSLRISPAHRTLP